MADVLTEKQRHYNMSRIRSKNTKPEEVVRKYLFSKGFRYRKNDARYPGKPDIVLSKYKTVIFIHGCFWHQHPGCKAARIPDTNSEFWKSKFEKNIAIITGLMPSLTSSRISSNSLYSIGRSASCSDRLIVSVA